MTSIEKEMGKIMKKYGISEQEAGAVLELVIECDVSSDTAVEILENDTLDDVYGVMLDENCSLEEAKCILEGEARRDTKLFKKNQKKQIKSQKRSLKKR